MEPEKKTQIVQDFLREALERAGPYLVVMGGAQQGRHVAVEDFPVVLGRSAQADVQMEDPGVSGRHFQVRRQLTTVYVKDLGSTNGTFLDDVRLEEETAVPVGSVLRAGTTLLRHEVLSRDEAQRKERLADDLRRARAYLMALLPEPLRDGPVHASWRYVPSADLAGDALGYDRLDARRIVFYLLDVCGHGVGPALHTVAAVNVLRKRSLPGVDFGRPEEVMDGLKRAFEMDQHGGLYFTLWYGVYDTADRELRYASAGHPPAFLLTGTDVRRLQTPNPPVGMVEGAAFEADVAQLGPNDRLYVFSDGTYEVRARDGRLMTLDDLQEIVALPSVPGIPEVDRVESALRRRMAARFFEDDFSLLVLHFMP